MGGGAWTPTESNTSRAGGAHVTVKSEDEMDEDEDDEDEDDDDDDEDEDDDDLGDGDEDGESGQANGSQRKRKRDESNGAATAQHRRPQDSGRQDSTNRSASGMSPDRSEQDQGGSRGAKPPRGSKACTHCRKLKMRCTGGENGPPCDRCKHSGYVCHFEESNRGKKAAASAAAAAKARAEKAVVANASNQPQAEEQGSPSNSFSAAGMKGAGKVKGKQSNVDLAKSLEKMEATLNTVLRSIRDPSHAQSLGHASGMLTRPQSPVREVLPPNPAASSSRRGLMHPPTSIAPSQLTASGSGPAGTIHPSQTQTQAKYASMAPGLVSSSASSSSASRLRRPPSPRLHSLPPDSMNPLGLLAEASLGNQMSSMRRNKQEQREGNTAGESKGGRPDTSGGKDEEAGGADGDAQGKQSSSKFKRKGSLSDEPALGVASKTYFRPGPMSMLPLRKVIIDRELPPELLTSGTVSDSEVLDLFSIFFHNCDQHIILLDPEWHTPQFVCGRSPFLFTVILAIASRYYTARPDLHTKCLQQATKEAFRCLEKGYKSVEIVQAFLLLTMWGQPAKRFEEDKSWIFAGIAFRVATDLNLHRKSVASLPGHPRTDDPTVLEREKEIRNRERTWIFCFVVDRSLSSQMGKPSMIREDYIIRNSRAWALDRLAQPADVALSAISEFVRLTSRQIDLLYSSVSSITGLNADLDFSNMIRIFYEQMEEWRHFWEARGLVVGDSRNRFPAIPPIDETLSPREIELCQLFAAANRPTPPPDDADHTMRTLYYLIQQAPLRYHYASLTVHSFGLQFGSSMDRGLYFYKCYDAAKALFFAARDGMRPILRYAPDTQILLLSFALVFMLKLTRPTFSNYADCDEIFGLVQEGADMLVEVAAGPTHTPALYGRFLRSTLAHAKAEKQGRGTGVNSAYSRFPSRAASPSSQQQTGAGVNIADLTRGLNEAKGHNGYSNGNNDPASASAAFSIGDSSADPMLGAGPGGRTTGRNSPIGGEHGGPDLSGGTGLPFNASSMFPSTSSTTMDSSSLMLDNVWWSQLVPAGLGGPLDGLNGGIDMQPASVPSDDSVDATPGSGHGGHGGSGEHHDAFPGLTDDTSGGYHGAGTGVTRPSSPHGDESSSAAGGKGAGGKGKDSSSGVLNQFGPGYLSFDFSHGF